MKGKQSLTNYFFLGGGVSSKNLVGRGCFSGNLRFLLPLFLAVLWIWIVDDFLAFDPTPVCDNFKCWIRIVIL